MERERDIPHYKEVKKYMELSMEEIDRMLEEIEKPIREKNKELEKK